MVAHWNGVWSLLTDREHPWTEQHESTRTFLELLYQSYLLRARVPALDHKGFSGQQKVPSRPRSFRNHGLSTPDLGNSRRHEWLNPIDIEQCTGTINE